MKQKPQVGQTLYSLNVGNAARNRDQVLTPVTVTKVGRKFFTTGEGWEATQYHIEDWREKTEYCASSKLYESTEEYELEVESRAICRQLYQAFEYSTNRYGLTIDELREMSYILSNRIKKNQ